MIKSSFIQDYRSCIKLFSLLKHILKLSFTEILFSLNTKEPSKT